MPACRQCGEDKEAAAFYECNKARCKECVKSSVRQYRMENLDSIQEYDRQRGRLPHRKAGVKGRAARYMAKKKAVMDRYFGNNPEKRKAHTITRNAIRDGKLKVKPCVRCGFAFGIQAHHEDYSKPLDVTWLCTPCHGERHREINAERRATRKAA
jgi:hypothetical protein